MISCTDIHDIAQDKAPKVTNSKGLDMEYQQQGLEQIYNKRLYIGILTKEMM